MIPQQHCRAQTPSTAALQLCTDLSNHLLNYKTTLLLKIVKSLVTILWIPLLKYLKFLV